MSPLSVRETQDRGCGGFLPGSQVCSNPESWTGPYNAVCHTHLLLLSLCHSHYLPSQEQYVYCHEVLADFVNSYDNYANFKEVM